MSKRSYLLIVLFLCLIGYVVTRQLRMAAESASTLLGEAVVKKIEYRISGVFRKLKRYPNADNEFETLVLGALDLGKYRRKIVFQKFIPGSKVAPAFFQVKIEGTTAAPPVILSLEYYGSDYQSDIRLKGRLIKQ